MLSVEIEFDALILDLWAKDEDFYPKFIQLGEEFTSCQLLAIYKGEIPYKK
jgi:hypothetical protein